MRRISRRKTALAGIVWGEMYIERARAEVSEEWTDSDKASTEDSLKRRSDGADFSPASLDS